MSGLMMDRSIAGINARIALGNSFIVPASRLSQRRLSQAEKEAVDIVTLAFASPIKGTAAMLCVPVAGRGVFTRAEEIRLNGVSGVPGPAPNERLGLVDTMVYSDSSSVTSESYDGAQLFHDFLCRKTIAVECEALEGSHYSTHVELKDLEFARFYGFNVFVEQGMPVSVWDALGRGSRILLNSANAIILGPGTRDGLGGRRSWSVAGDMYAMDPGVMAGIDPQVAHGIGNMIAVAIPMQDRAVLDDLEAWQSSRFVSEECAAAESLLCQRIVAGEFTLTDTDARL